MFGSKYKRKYEQLVSDIKAEIWLNDGIVKFYEENMDRLENDGTNVTAIKADKICRQECVDILEQILRRSEET